ncbi:MAG TPA: CotH kinase family protein, partial [Kiritimatiellia bacterium]|nr:CotH kinase family protein [Kiritimatiellia bacterium]
MNPCPSPLRCLALLGALCFSLAPAARAQDPRGYHGRWNDWNHAPMSLDRGAWRVTVQAVAADDNDFKIASEGWSNEWTHDGFLPLGEVGTAYTSGGNTAIEAVPGRFYSFAMDDVAYGVQGRMIVQETENPPVEIASVDPAVAESNAVVTLATSAAPGPGERLFVRYTFHNWISSAFAEASGSGTNWTAEIPHAPENAGRTCAFYALSTTVAAPAHSDADLQTLRWNDNAGAGYSYAVPGDPPPARLVINEVLSSNDSSEQDEDGDYSDWLEIWNDSAVAVDLDGWGLSDSDASPFKWTFGAVTIQPGEFLVVWASSKNRPAITNGNQLHANFAISAGGEELLLTQPDGTLMDRFEPVAIPTDFSYGRQPDGTGPWKYFTDHTPGAPNSTTGYSAILEPPVYSIPGGFFTTNVEVTLSTVQTGAVVRYTLDGSEPTEASPIFTNAIPLGSKAGISNNLSEIPTNFDPNPGPPYYEGWQPPDGEVFKFHVLRARAFQEGALPSPAVTQSYIIDAAGTNRYTLPVVSIATDAANLFDDDIGIYTPVNDNMLQSGSAWERPGTIEFFEPDGSLAFDGPIGVRLHGNTTRTRPRKALRIYSRGDGPFEYQLFPDKPVAEFDTFILRNGGNDWGNGVIRDLFLQSLAENARLDRQFGRPVLVFLNGEYWGLHDLRDRFDEDYILRHYDLDEDEFVQVEIDYAVSSSYIPIFDEGHELLGSDYSNLWNFVRTHDLIDANHYAAVADRLDLGSFMDFFQANIFFGNTDWPGNNLRAWRSVETNRTEDAPAFLDGRWRYMLYDADFGFGLDFIYVPGFDEFAQHDTLAFAASPDQTANANHPDATLIFRRLLENDGFRRDFVTRFCDQLNTAYSRAHVTNRWAQWVEILAPEMPEHAARWRQPTNWSYECDRIRSYGEQRTDAVWDHIQDYFDLAAPVDLTVDVANPAAGFVRVNTLDLDADTPGFAGYPWTGAYFTNFPVTLTAVERTGYEFVAWFKDAEVFGADPSIELTLTNAAQFEAVFVENLPPQIVAPGIVFQELVENETSAQFDLDTIFFDPEGAPLTFDAASGDTNLVGVAILDSIMSVSPLRRGEADVTVTASDGTSTAGMSFRVLVHPAPHVLQNGAFAFGEWDPERPEKTYPEHMLFLQSDENDPGINTLLRNAYYIAHDDYHADDADKIGFPYKLTGRTR